MPAQHIDLLIRDRKSRIKKLQEEIERFENAQNFLECDWTEEDFASVGKFPRPNGSGEGFNQHTYEDVRFSYYLPCAGDGVTAVGVCKELGNDNPQFTFEQGDIVNLGDVLLQVMVWFATPAGRTQAIFVEISPCATSLRRRGERLLEEAKPGPFDWIKLP